MSFPSSNYQDAGRGPRLQKVLADAGVASRRDCEAMIESGAVSVNGTVVAELPAWVDPAADRITVNGRRIQTQPEPIYILLHKPRGVVCTNDDPEGRRRAIDLVAHPRRPRLYPVGRLDMDSSGLLLLTNDGAMANALTHPRYGVHKVYEVVVEGRLDATAIEKLERGLFLTDRRQAGGGRTARSRLTVFKRDRERTILRMELREGRNRQIRRMMARLGYRVKKLRRVQLGPLQLKGLRSGHWRELRPPEIRALRSAARSGGRPGARPRGGAPGTASSRPSRSAGRRRDHR